MTDTDGMYDRCCGERPAVSEYGDMLRVSCQICGAATRWLHRLDVMIEWNKMKKKGGKMKKMVYYIGLIGFLAFLLLAPLLAFGITITGGGL